jgi:hypothetical protein
MVAFSTPISRLSMVVSGLQVLTSSGEEVFFKIKRNTKLSKLQAAYANKVGKDVGTIRYVHESRLNCRFLAIRFRYMAD